MEAELSYEEVQEIVLQSLTSFYTDADALPPLEAREFEAHKPASVVDVLQAHHTNDEQPM